MWQDSIVNEVRQIREAHAEKFKFDLEAIYCDLKKQERKSERKVVSFPPKTAMIFEVEHKITATV